LRVRVRDGSHEQSHVPGDRDRVPDDERALVLRQRLARAGAGALRRRRYRVRAGGSRRKAERSDRPQTKALTDGLRSPSAHCARLTAFAASLRAAFARPRTNPLRAASLAFAIDLQLLHFELETAAGETQLLGGAGDVPIGESQRLQDGVALDALGGGADA